MQLSSYGEVTHDIHINVTPFYIPERSVPEKDYYFFAYKVIIENRSNSSVKLLSRKWFIRDGNGRKESVDGPGVVGQKPVLKPGESFDYTSFCPLETPTGNMRGQFRMIGTEGQGFDVEVPVFFFRTDKMALH